jgi:hypothetical protein
VTLVRTDISEKHIVSIIKATGISELRKILGVTSNKRMLQRNTANVSSSPILVTLMMEAIRSSETSVITIATQHNIPEDAIIHSHDRENLKSYILSLNFRWHDQQWMCFAAAVTAPHTLHHLSALGSTS